MPELADIISRVTGKSIKFECVTEEEFAEICREGKEDVSEEMIEVLTSLDRAVDNGEFATVTDHVRRLTGTPPETAESYLSRTARII